MALETITQILAPTNAPYINGINGERRISAAILDAFYQGLVEKDGKGVDDNFVSAGDAEEATQIVVHRVLPVNMAPREQGASRNGASYSQNQHYVQTEDVGIDILQVLDDPILIPRASTDRINVDLLAKQIKIFSDRFSTIFNGATTASKILSSYLAKSSGKEINEQVISSNDGAVVRDGFIEGHSLLLNGDPAHGIDVFPEDTQVAIFKVAYRHILKSKGVLELGGANEAYAILAAGSLNNKGEQKVLDDGYIGHLDGVDVKCISNMSLSAAAQFLGFPKSELYSKGSPFLGYVSSSYANARGASTRERTKVVDEVNGQGVRLLPYIKFGAVSWYPLGNVFFTSKQWNPFKVLKDILTAAGHSGEVTFKLKSWGSRLYSDLTPAKITNVSVTGGTASVGALSALDDWGVTNHVVAASYVITDSEVLTLSDFAAGTPANVDFDGSGTVDISGSTAGKYLSVLTVSDDGTVTIASKVLTA